MLCYANAPNRLHHLELVRSSKRACTKIKQRVVSRSVINANARIDGLGHQTQQSRYASAGSACKASNTPQGEPSPEEKTRRALELAQQALIKAQDSSQNVSKLPSAKGPREVRPIFICTPCPYCKYFGHQVKIVTRAVQLAR